MRRPVQLLYSEECSTLSLAVARERQIKRWSAAKKRALVERRLGDLKQRASQAKIADIQTNDSYHASTYGYYLEALMVFGRVTGRDPRSLGSDECSGMELGLSGAQVSKLQQVAFDELAAAGPLAPNPNDQRTRGPLSGELTISDVKSDAPEHLPGDIGCR